MKQFSNALAVARADIEDFLFHEARLLDAWDLEAWLEMLASDATYLVPSLDFPAGDPESSLCLIADDRRRIELRVKQLRSPFAWSEAPQSRTRRLISNAYITEQTKDTVDVQANFAVWRFKNDSTDLYVGQYVHRFVIEDHRLLIQERRAVLDLETLRPHGKLSFIL